MTQEEIDLVATAVCKQLEVHKNSFWVEPEKHYNHHREIEQLLSDYKEVKGLFWKAFFGFAIVGTFAVALLGFSIVNLSKFIPK